MSLFLELMRLEALYAAAQSDPRSCPRDREILRSKIQDLLEEAKAEKARAAEQTNITPGEVESIKENVGKLRTTLTNASQSAEADAMRHYLDIWQHELVRLWAQES